MICGGRSPHFFVISYEGTPRESLVGDTVTVKEYGNKKEVSYAIKSLTQRNEPQYDELSASRFFVAVVFLLCFFFSSFLLIFHFNN